MYKYKRQVKLVLFIWSINMIIITIGDFFPKFTWLLNLRGVLNICIILSLLKYLKKIDIISKIILFFVAYLFTLTLFSSNFSLSVSMVSKTSIALMTYVLGYQFFKTNQGFSKLTVYYKYLYILLLGTMIFSNLTGLGRGGYGDDIEASESVMYGSMGVAISRLFVTIIIISPIFIYQIKKKRIQNQTILAVFIIIIITLLANKRSVTLGLVFAAAIYGLLVERKIIIKYIFYIFLLTVATLPLYKDLLNSSYETRSGQYYFVSDSSDNMIKEGRYWETLSVIDAMVNDNISHFFFGSEIFNEFDYFNTERMLHIDYNTILNGSGVFGLSLFLLIYFKLITKGIFYYRTVNNKYLKLVSISVIALSVCLVFISIGGTIRNVDYAGPIYLYLGAALGYLENEKLRFRHINQIENLNKKIKEIN